MNRRDFLVTSGSAVLASSTLMSQQTPVVGLDFELSYVPDMNPSNIDSVQVALTKFNITPRYINDSENFTIEVDVDLDDYTGSDTVTIEKNLENGVTYDLSDEVDSLVIDGLSIDQNESSLDGEVRIGVDHTDFSSDYIREFRINRAQLYLESSTCDDVGYCGSMIEYNGTTIRSSRGLNLMVFDKNTNPVFWGSYDVHSGQDYRYTSSFNDDGTVRDVNQVSCTDGCPTRSLTSRLDEYKDKPNHYLVIVGDDQPMPHNQQSEDSVSSDERELYNRFIELGAELNTNNTDKGRLYYRDNFLFASYTDSSGNHNLMTEKYTRRGSISGVGKVTSELVLSPPQ